MRRNWLGARVDIGSVTCSSEVDELSTGRLVLAKQEVRLSRQPQTKMTKCRLGEVVRASKDYLEPVARSLVPKGDPRARV